MVLLGLVIYLTRTRRDVIPVPAEAGAEPRLSRNAEPAVLVVTSKATATSALIDAMRNRAAAGPAPAAVSVAAEYRLAVEAGGCRRE